MNNKGAVLILVVVCLVVPLLIIGGAYCYAVIHDAHLTRHQLDLQKANFLAESGIERAALRIKTNNIVAAENYQLNLGGAALNDLENQNIAVAITDLGSDTFQVTSTSQFGQVNCTLNAIIVRNLAGSVFDYSYFVNNWGWWYGGGLTAYGDLRSNGRFDFRGNPTVEGRVYAGFDINDHGEGTRGASGEQDADGNYINRYPNSRKLDMPNLNDLGYYENLAVEQSGKITIDNNVVIDKVFGDDAGESGNIVLIGTTSKPIKIEGTVVVRGDVVIKGVIDGQGSIYAGRNLYLADDITYKNPPQPPIEVTPTTSESSIENWVHGNQNKDFVGFAARESIILGDYTGGNGGPWYSDGYITGMGNEDVGEDGIPGTGDAGEGDGVFDHQYEDSDADGVFDGYYNMGDVQTQAAINTFANCPADINSFSDIATNTLNQLDGIFYTNHFLAGRIGVGGVINGSMVAKDEAIIYTNTLNINYDPRIKSSGAGQNKLIAVTLPIAQRVQVIRWWR